MQLNVFHRDGAWRSTPEELDGDALSRLCRRIKEGVQAHTGITEGTFFRDQGWHFYMLGRLIERADQITRLLDIKYHLLVRGSDEERRVAELTQWNAVLRAAAGYHAFRRVAQAGFEPWDVVTFLLADTAFARSVGAVRARHRLAPATSSAAATACATPPRCWQHRRVAGHAAGPVASCSLPDGLHELPRPAADRSQPARRADRHHVLPRLAAVAAAAARRQRAREAARNKAWAKAA